MTSRKLYDKRCADEEEKEEEDKWDGIFNKREKGEKIHSVGGVISFMTTQISMIL